MATTTTTTSVAEARKELQSLLARNGWNITPNQQQRALDLLQRHPSLASEWYEEGGNHFDSCLRQSYTPLSYFILLAGNNNNHHNHNNSSNHNNNKNESTAAVVERIRIIYYLYPPAMEQKNHRGRLPLHEACALGLSHDMIAFLAQEHPLAASIPDDCRQYPFQLALRSSSFGLNFGGSSSSSCQMSLRTLRLLLDLYPSAFDKHDFGGRLPLERAILDQYPAPVLEYLFSKQVERMSTNNQRHYSLPEDIVGTLDLAQGVTVLLPHVTSFQCTISIWKTEGLEYLLEQLTRNQSITHLSLCLPRVHFRTFASARQKLERLLQTNRVLESIELYGQSPEGHSQYGTAASGLAQYRRSRFDTSDEGDQDDSYSLQCIVNGLWKRPQQYNRLESLRLVQFSCTATTHQRWKDLMDCPNAPRCLHLESVRLPHAGKKGLNNDTIATAASSTKRVEELSVCKYETTDSYHGDGLCSLLRYAVPFLKKLHLEQCLSPPPSSTENDNNDKSSCCVTQCLAELLQSNNARLESLSLCDSLDIVQMTKALTDKNNNNNNNNHLKEYRIKTKKIASSAEVLEVTQCLWKALKQHCVTLEHFEVVTPPKNKRAPLGKNNAALIVKQQEEIAYYTTLNKYGRAMARNPQATREEFIQCIRHVADNHMVESSSSSSSSLLDDATKILYGLLREAPALWSSTPTTAASRRNSNNTYFCPSTCDSTANTQKRNYPLPLIKEEPGVVGSIDMFPAVMMSDDAVKRIRKN